jgi:hypothetical protein
MGTNNSVDGESRLRGKALDGSDRDGAADHVKASQDRTPESILRTDDEEDTLYDDGLELEDDSQPQSGTDGKDDNAR